MRHRNATLLAIIIPINDIYDAPDLSRNTTAARRLIANQSSIINRYITAAHPATIQ